MPEINDVLRDAVVFTDLPAYGSVYMHTGTDARHWDADYLNIGMRRKISTATASLSMTLILTGWLDRILAIPQAHKPSTPGYGYKRWCE